MFLGCDASMLVAKKFAKTRDASRAQGDQDPLEEIGSLETRATDSIKISSVILEIKSLSMGKKIRVVSN